jgi:hypothetical protein
MEEDLDSWFSYLCSSVKSVVRKSELKRRIEPRITQKAQMEEDLDSWFSYLCSSVKSVVKNLN